ncbi:MAG: DNA translocase FtsK [Muribaculaceae bacterium]|nr:DNA translocase FtsK [Roseburia sp.]MCM1430973.1 DNA translocase FtsK [Muribaculaceae bacterium]MCM1493793.1 DNA translocase FtsK [Muribaculaceae bacterium]
MAAGNRRKTSSKTNHRTGKTKKERMEEMEKAESFRTEVILWIIVAVSLLLFISNLGFGGAVGRTVSGFLFGVFGLVAYVLPVLLLIGSFFVVSNRGNFLASIKLVAAVLFVFFLCLFLSLVAYGGDIRPPLEAYTYSAETKNGGGIIGGAIAYVIVQGFGLVGAYIIDVIVLIICLVLITERSALGGMREGGKKVYESAKENNERYREYREYKSKETKKRRMDKKVSGVSIDTKIEQESAAKPSDEMGELHPQEAAGIPVVQEEKTVALTAGGEDTAKAVSPKIQTPEPVIAGDFTRDISPEAALPEVEAVQEKPAAEKKEKPKPLPEEEIEKEIAQVVQEITAQEQPHREYVFPSVDLLTPGNGRKAGNTESQLKETAEKLRQVLATFGVEVTVTNISCGPAVTRYEIQPEMGVKVSKIVGLSDDIKLNLAAADIRIEAPIPGKAAVGIEVPNKENVTVSFRELITSPEFQKSKSKISFAVGKDISGKVMVTDIAKMPHLLIAGATGSGKSVCINTIIMSILYKASPDEVKLLMIDPKVVELSVYNGIPHLIIPVVTDPKKASGALNWAVAEMTERYEKFAEANVREINGYNAKVDSIEMPEGQERPQKLPQIVVIVDELADLMMVASGDVEEAICRLAQLARAAGIHLVIATQRPSVNVITGLIKANMPSRIAFAVTSGTDSRTILDMIGAEKLLGKGDMLFHPQGIPKPVRVQGAFVSDKEVADVVGFITEQNGAAVYSDSVQQKMESIQNSANSTVAISDADEQDDGRDSYFSEAARVIVDKEKASIGMLQRYLKVGFNRAARIMDQMEEAGIVGPEEGTKPRKVLMSPEELENYISENL